MFRRVAHQHASVCEVGRLKVRTRRPMRPAMQIAISGLHAARTQFDLHARNIASISTEGARVDLPAEIVGTITAQHMYDASARLLRAQVEQDRALLDVLA